MELFDILFVNRVMTRRVCTYTCLKFETDGINGEINYEINSIDDICKRRVIFMMLIKIIVLYSIISFDKESNNYRVKLLLQWQYILERYVFI